MSINTHLPGRVHNTNLPLTKALFPLFEAVINSIHSIEDSGKPMDDGYIAIDIIRSTQGSLPLVEDASRPGREPEEDIQGFFITDNGVGFNEANLNSFKTLDSEYKKSRGCRGIGRLLWLKAFTIIHIESVFIGEDGNNYRRLFNFSESHGVDNESLTVVDKSEPIKTKVHLDGFFEHYRSSAKKTGQSIAEDILEHCLWYFVRKGGAPKIVLFDGPLRLQLDDIFEQTMHDVATGEQIEIKGYEFDLTHVKVRSKAALHHLIAYCADNRLVMEENIKGKIPGLFEKLNDETGEFVYSCYVSSPYLDMNVRSERTGFNIDEVNEDDLFANSQLSLLEIKNTVLKAAQTHLSEYLKENIQKGLNRVEVYIDTKAPRYRPIISRMPKEQLAVNPDISDKDLELALHKQYYVIERRLIAQGHELMQPVSDETMDDYETRISEYLNTVQDVKMADLANYVSHRKVILDLYHRALEKDSDGNYAREDLIHSLVMPMRVTSEKVDTHYLNLWMLDERLAFHDYLASDKSLNSMPITSSKERKEPDIIALQIADNPILFTEESIPPFASITIVEFKRPMRNDAEAGTEKDPILQCLDYLKKIRSGNVTTKNGRPIGNGQDVPAYCYIICDLTPRMRELCQDRDLTITSDLNGYFGYIKHHKTYIEVLSFDRMLTAATQRNKAFFDKLGLPSD